jgi:hypothetical protein
MMKELFYTILSGRIIVPISGTETKTDGPYSGKVVHEDLIKI